MPFSPLIVLTALLHAYIGWRLVPAWSGEPVVQWLLSALLVASVLLMSGSFFLHRARQDGLTRMITWSGLIFMGLFSSLFVLTLLRDLLLLGASAWQAATLAWPGFADMARLSGHAVPLLALLVTAIGFLNARRTAAIVPVDVPIAGLPQALEGFTIAQISDIHVGPTIGREYLDAIVRTVNQLDADLVAVTGDLVDGRVPELSAHIAPLADLHSRHGTFFVTGNHEYYSGAEAWVAELQRIGLRVLQNEHVVIDHEGEPLVLAGVTDYSAHHFDPARRSDPHAAVAGAPRDAQVRVLLAHQPRSAEAAEQAGFHLQLSGHTHGGQFWPWNHFVPLQQPYTAGLHRLRQLWVYTSRGTGYWGPPKRFGAPSEITHLRLVSDTARGLDIGAGVASDQNAQTTSNDNARSPACHAR